MSSCSLPKWQPLTRQSLSIGALVVTDLLTKYQTAPSTRGSRWYVKARGASKPLRDASWAPPGLGGSERPAELPVPSSELKNDGPELLKVTKSVNTFELVRLTSAGQDGGEDGENLVVQWFLASNILT